MSEDSRKPAGRTLQRESGFVISYTCGCHGILFSAVLDRDMRSFFRLINMQHPLSHDLGRPGLRRLRSTALPSEYECIARASSCLLPTHRRAFRVIMAVK